MISNNGSKKTLAKKKQRRTKMGLKSWWRAADPTGKKIVKVFGAIVLLSIIYTVATMIF